MENTAWFWYTNQRGGRRRCNGGRRARSHSTYKPGEQSSSDILLPKNIILEMCIVARIGTGDDTQQIQQQSTGLGATQNARGPVDGIDLLQQPDVEVVGIEIGLQSLDRRQAADSRRHFMLVRGRKESGEATTR